MDFLARAYLPMAMELLPITRRHAKHNMLCLPISSMPHLAPVVLKYQFGLSVLQWKAIITPG